MEGWHFLNILAVDAAYEQHELRLRMSRVRSQFRLEVDPFDVTRNAFVKLYRLPQPVVRNLIEAIRPSMPQSQRRSAVSVESKVLAALSFFASGSYQRIVGQDFNVAMSQSMISRSVEEVSEAINDRLLNVWIRFPMDRAERNNIKTRFYNATGMPGVIGCIDCTHIAIVRPSLHEETYINRRSYHSKNVQAICDYDLRIMNLNAQYGGATNDAFIWRNSLAKQELERRYYVNRERGEWLLGDSGYANEPWVMLPILHADNGTPEEHYTDVHCRTRCCVERCFGLLKARWRCLLRHRVLHYSPEKVGCIVNACAVLHNIAIDGRVPEPEQLNGDDIAAEMALDVGDLQAGLINQNVLAAARHTRDRLVARMWEQRR